MNEFDKIIRQLSDAMGWIRSAKENEAIRDEMCSAAAKTCRDLAERIEQLNTFGANE